MALPALPSSLLLLVHLHLLEYPYADKPEYDHNVFNPKIRGMKDRTKTMEDISHFLVRKLERDRVKSILPGYPCKKPSDSVAYRAALAKYLETLRHSAIGGGHSGPAGGTMRKSPKGEIFNRSNSSSTWWKDVLVRKSTLEECSGERFERIMVALSTQALMRYVKGASDPAVLHSPLAQPVTYPTMLTNAMHARKEWLRRMDELRRQKSQVVHLKESLVRSSGSTSKYGSLKTSRLVRFAESKYQDLLAGWSASALDFFIEISGIRIPRPAATGNADRASAPLASAFGKSSLLKPTSRAIPQPLPVAAAHHPSYLRKLRKPVSADSSSSKSRASQSRLHASDRQMHASGAQTAPQRHAASQTARVAEREKQMKRALLKELGEVRRRRGEAEQRLQQALLQKKPVRRARERQLNLWVPPSPTTICFDAISDRASTHALAAPDSFSEPLQTRIDRVRAKWKAAASAAPPQKQTSRLPLPSGEIHKAVNPPPKRADQDAGKLRNSSKAFVQPPKTAALSEAFPQSHRTGVKTDARKTAQSDVGDTEVTQILEQLRDDSDEERDEDTKIFSSPGKPLASLSRTPGSVLSTVKRRKRETFAMPPGGAPMPLPLSGLDDEEDEGDGGDAFSEKSNDSGYEEGHSVSLRDILLHADTTGINLAAHLEDEMEDDDPFY
ncbi:hypothetical protein HDZ31DRAFT_66871 [Schizophyllum fasciatum]